MDRLGNAAPMTMPRYPLGLAVCLDCFHSQNLGAVDPEILYRDYPYVSGTSATLRNYFRQFVDDVEADFMPRKLRVLDIAANDGSLLEVFRAHGHEVLGVDPAKNLVEIAAEKGIEVLDFPWERVPSQRLGGKFDVIVAMNVLGHVRRPSLFLQLCRHALAPGGRIYVQTSQARMVERGEFDTVYAEHLSFFTAKSLNTLVSRCDLSLIDLKRVPVHGTSYLATMGPGVQIFQFEHDLVDTEEAAGYYRLETYDGFQKRADDLAAQVRSAIEVYRAKGFEIAGYGAAAKGITFLTYAGIELAWIVDDNPLKVGKFVANLPTSIISMPASGKRVLWVIPAWNMAAEIRAKIEAARPGARDAFLTYFPELIVDDPEAYQ